jgi:hypothetical protein
MVQFLKADRATVEHIITQVSGVQSVRVVYTEEGIVDAIHILGNPQGCASQIVQDVVQALTVRANIRIDSDRITFMQHTPRESQPLAPRVQLREIMHAAGEPIVTVILALHGRRILGIGRNRSGQSDSVEQRAAEATVHAINRLIEPRARARLDLMQQVIIGDLTACLVQISLINGEATITALGVSRVGDAVAEAGARAVLDAVNRHLPHLID